LPGQYYCRINEAAVFGFRYPHTKSLSSSTSILVTILWYYSRSTKKLKQNCNLRTNSLWTDWTVCGKCCLYFNPICVCSHRNIREIQAYSGLEINLDIIPVSQDFRPPPLHFRPPGGEIPRNSPPFRKLSPL
jgi:hypothetical protein